MSFGRLAQVRLDKSSMPAPAIAELYLNGSGDRVLSPEHALFHAATALTWPRALTSDDDYLACHIAALLVDDSMRPAPDRNLPRCGLRLSTRASAARSVRSMLARARRASMSELHVWRCKFELGSPASRSRRRSHSA